MAPLVYTQMAFFFADVYWHIAQTEEVFCEKEHAREHHSSCTVLSASEKATGFINPLYPVWGATLRGFLWALCFPLAAEKPMTGL